MHTYLLVLSFVFKKQLWELLSHKAIVVKKHVPSQWGYRFCQILYFYLIAINMFFVYFSEGFVQYMYCQILWHLQELLKLLPPPKTNKVATRLFQINFFFWVRKHIYQSFRIAGSCEIYVLQNRGCHITISTLRSFLELLISKRFILSH